MSKSDSFDVSKLPPFRIELLSNHHTIDKFDCGEESLNEYLKRYSRWNASAGIGTTYVIVRGEEMVVLGYYTIIVGQILITNLPVQIAKRLPKYPVPVIKVGRLATDRSVQGQGLGEALLIDALFRAERISGQAGVYAVEVDALNEAAKTFYQRYGFQSLNDDPRHLYLPIKLIGKLR